MSEHIAKRSNAGQALNAGSGQRPFSSTPELRWINMDINPKWESEEVGDWNDLSRFTDASFDIVVSHHSIEHAGCNEAAGFVREAHRILKPRGSLLVFVPDLRALAQRWLIGQLDTQLYMTNVFGPFDSTEASRHRWGYDREHMLQFLRGNAPWALVKPFDWREISGGDFARDWHILSMEAVK
jgi:predicted SAM-dependent methyltransferase